MFARLFSIACAGAAALLATYAFADAPRRQWSGAALLLHANAVSGERLAVLLEAPDGAIVGPARVVDTPDTRSH